MRTRIIAVLLAAVLAVVGGVTLVSYVQSANARAFNGATLVDVYVATGAIAAGTTGEALAASVDLRPIADAYVVPGAITDLAAVAGLVATSPIAEGEQLIASRFESPAEFVAGSGSIPVPDGLDELSFAVDAQRVLGGRLVPGDLISVYLSFDSVTPEVPQATTFALSRVLVTSVTTDAVLPGVAAAATGDTEVTPTTGGQVLVSVAVSADDAEKIVFGAEFGSLWVARQSDNSTDPKKSTIGREDLE